MMKLIAGLVVAALVIVGIGGLVMMRSFASPKVDDPTPEPVAAVAPAPVPSPTTEVIRPLAGANTGGKCINPPMNTICVR
jgi:hypothetical protein